MAMTFQTQAGGAGRGNGTKNENARMRRGFVRSSGKSTANSTSCKSNSRGFGATVAERLAFSPPTKVNGAQSSAGSPDFRKWESSQTMPLVGGFSRGYPASPAPSFRRRSILSSNTLIVYQDLAVKSRTNLFIHSS
ncbi:hypothetical protein PR048_003887 [Dryococelus australis]|uniref:Uncharacterized protein n=1 Tax=Dryococelus australis TaxID=614101 RepID=A0ABQ9IPC3_9NEOP|nr:hypothetical protein PR048_003887 [Dryococelus australis]